MLLKKLILSLLSIAVSIAAMAQNEKSLFPHPKWSLQSNIYEVNVRQYTKEGTFNAFAKELPRLRKMGVEILWFMPITPISLKGRKMNETELGSYYAVQDYKGINPEFGNMNDFVALVKKAHALGFKVITDWVPNHTGLDNGWVERHPDFYNKDEKGNLISPFDWTDVYKLNYDNKEMRDSMIDAMKFWIKNADIDGFRCDVAEPVPADFWKTCIGELKQMKDVFMLAEGNTGWLHECGFDATYNWSAMGYTRDLYDGKMSATAFIDSLNANYKRYPKDAMRMNFTTNHDENSWNGTEFEKYGDAYKMFSVFSMTYNQTIPLVYSGQEIPNKKRLKFFVKDPIEWNGLEMESFYRTLFYNRKTNQAFASDASYRRIKTSEDENVLCYMREKGKRKAFTLLNLTSKPQSVTIEDKNFSGYVINIFDGTKWMNLKPGQKFELKSWGYLVFCNGIKHGD
jgi:glycosidase